MAEKNLTAQYLLDNGVKPETPKEFVRGELKRRMRDLKEKSDSYDDIMQALFPNTILETETLEELAAALIDGSNILLFGPPGSGKTNLAKDVWGLFPGKIWAVDGCPVQDHPYSLFDPHFSKVMPPCPFCKTRHGGVRYESVGEFDPSRIDPKQIPVSQIFMREGHGLARIQGSSEVFPDNLTGTLNLHKLEEIGDPTSPLVLEPGKLLQANKGLLMVDEIGKLPKGTQNVLLQALQENIVTPAKSRETFPAAFITICTSNLQDLDNINEPLNDRLSNIHIKFNRGMGKNRQIMDMALGKQTSRVFIPNMLRDSAINLVDLWRKRQDASFEQSEVGSNRAMIDIILRAEAYAVLGNDSVITPDDFKKGATNAMLGRIRARSGDSFTRNEKVISDFLGNNLTKAIYLSARDYWCTFFRDALNRDKPEGKRVVEESRKILKEPKLAEGVDAEGYRYKKFKKFADFALEYERHKNESPDSLVAVSAFGFLDSMDVFEERRADERFLLNRKG